MVTWPMMSCVQNGDTLRLVVLLETNNGCKNVNQRGLNVTKVVRQWDRYLVPQKLSESISCSYCQQGRSQRGAWGPRPSREPIQKKLSVSICKWQQQPAANHPWTALAALDHCAIFPNLSIVPQLLAIFPITTAEAERCFSKMERTLTAMIAIRSSMEEERFEALLLLQVHHEDTPSVDAVLDHLAATSARLKFVLLQC